MQGWALCAFAGAIDSENTSAEPASNAHPCEVVRKQFQVIPASLLQIVGRMYGLGPAPVLSSCGPAVSPGFLKQIPYPKAVPVKGCSPRVSPGNCAAKSRCAAYQCPGRSQRRATCAGHQARRADESAGG